MNDERRAFQRLTLVEPLDGWFGDYSVRLVDVSASGAQIEHDEPIPSDAHGLLRFWWRGHEVEILARTARLIQHDRTGIQFVEDSDTLRTLIAASAADVLRAMEANARGDRSGNMLGDDTITAAWQLPITGYVCWTLEEGKGWRSRVSTLPEQPENGFTISAAESEEQVEMLRRTYENGDPEARRMTRMLAEISVTS